MVKLEYFVSHGLAVTIYVWRSERGGKKGGWRDVEHGDGFRAARDRGRMHAQIGAGTATGIMTRDETKQFRAILTKAADACLK